MNSRNRIRRKMILGTVVFLLPKFAVGDLYDDYINSTSKKPFVAFHARKGVPGHAFVGIGVQIDSGQLVYEALYGYYPDESGMLASVKLLFSKVSGAIDYKWQDISWDVTYKVTVDDSQKAAALNVAKQWQSTDPKYNLINSGGKNCSTFAAEVASSIGLLVPSGAGSMLPAQYITLLRKNNSNNP